MAADGLLAETTVFLASTGAGAAHRVQLDSCRGGVLASARSLSSSEIRAERLSFKLAASLMQGVAAFGATLRHIDLELHPPR